MTSDSGTHRNTGPDHASYGDGPALDRHAPLRYGYSLDDLERLAILAARYCRWGQGLAFSDRIDLGMSAMAECIYTATEPPTTADLRLAASQAISQRLNEEIQNHGLDTPAPTPRKRPAFERYWMITTAPTPSPEDQVVEPLARTQIWPHLSRRQREAFQALAACDDYRAAARYLNINYRAFRARIADGRRVFMRYWHEGEIPAPMYAPDRRGAKDNCYFPTYSLRKRNRRRQAQRANGEPVDLYRAGRRITLPISDAELARRYTNGATMTELAQQLGVSMTTIRHRLDSTGTPRRGRGGTHHRPAGNT